MSVGLKRAKLRKPSRARASYRPRLALAAALWVLCTWQAHGANLPPPAVHQQTTEKPFDLVVQDLAFAVGQHNFRITGRHDIGKALRERGVEDAADSLVLSFCSITYAREALALDPALIAMMPCRVAVYDTGRGVVLSTLLLPEHTSAPQVNMFSRKINGILREIINFAGAQW